MSRACPPPGALTKHFERASELELARAISSSLRESVCRPICFLDCYDATTIQAKFHAWLFQILGLGIE